MGFHYHARGAASWGDRLRFIHAFCIFAAVLALNGCAAGFLSRNSVFDQKKISIQTLSLFSQEENPRSPNAPWHGDWIFRRERLTLVDRELRKNKADLLIMQNELTRKGNPYDSDRNILLAGALIGYQWYDIGIKESQDTEEVESLSLATNLPLRIDMRTKATQVWDLSSGGHLALNTVNLEGQPILVFNIDMNDEPENIHKLAEVLNGFKDEPPLCAKRMIIAGSFAGEESDGRYLRFKEAFNLVDTSQGICEEERVCDTSSSTNDIMRVTRGDLRPMRTDRILVHRSALIYQSGLNFNRTTKDSDRFTNYGLQKIWPTQRYGWMADIRLARCPESKP